MEKTLEERWFPFSTYALDDIEHKKIFCFHHAGGSASVYRKWTLEKKKMNFICVELPGKGTRRREPFVGAMRSTSASSRPRARSRPSRPSCPG